MATETAESGHHIYGPSTLDALSLCVRFKYSDADKDAADEGTRLHKAFETGVTTGLDQEQASCVTMARDYVESLKYEAGASKEDWEDKAEAKLELKGLTHGTSDRVLINLHTGDAHVIDFKATRADMPHDFQLRAYGACLAEMEPGVVTITTHVVSPRLGSTVRSIHKAAVLLEETRREIEALYAKIADPAIPPTAHEDLCSKCANAATCPALCRTVSAVAKGCGLPLPEAFSPDAIVSLRDRAIAQVLAGAMINWGEQVKKNNSAFVETSGTDIPGFKRMRRSTGLRVPKEKVLEAFLALENAFGLSQDDIKECCSLTLGDVVSMLSLRCGLPEATAKDSLREVLTGIAQDGSCSYLAKERRLSDSALLLAAGSPQ